MTTKIDKLQLRPHAAARAGVVVGNVSDFCYTEGMHDTCAAQRHLHSCTLSKQPTRENTAFLKFLVSVAFFGYWKRGTTNSRHCDARGSLRV